MSREAIYDHIEPLRRHCRYAPDSDEADHEADDSGDALIAYKDALRTRSPGCTTNW
jgi:hypothetical protein